MSVCYWMHLNIRTWQLSFESFERAELIGELGSWTNEPIMVTSFEERMFAVSVICEDM